MPGFARAPGMLHPAGRARSCSSTTSHRARGPETRPHPLLPPCPFSSNTHLPFLCPQAMARPGESQRIPGWQQPSSGRWERGGACTCPWPRAGTRRCKGGKRGQDGGAASSVCRGGGWSTAKPGEEAAWSRLWDLGLGARVWGASRQPPGAIPVPKLQGEVPAGAAPWAPVCLPASVLPGRKGRLMALGSSVPPAPCCWQSPGRSCEGVLLPAGCPKAALCSAPVLVQGHIRGLGCPGLPCSPAEAVGLHFGVSGLLPAGAAGPGQSIGGLPALCPLWRSPHAWEAGSTLPLGNASARFPGNLKQSKSSPRHAS